MMRRIMCCFLLVVYWAVNDGHGSIKVSLNKLYSDPAAYNHKLIQISGVISHGYEQFTLTSPNCPKRCGVWLEYGGTIASGTIYCCGISSARQRNEPLVVENISVPLLQDETFHKFDELIHPKSHESIEVKATVIGQFFAGHRIDYPEIREPFWGGYGHFGCCSLLVIQKVVSIDQ